jgi:hypothetical protein
MPTTPSRARRWIKSGKATPFWKRGIFCVRLNVQPSNDYKHPIAVGIDPGSKREGFTVKSNLHTYLNIQSHAVDWVKDHVETRRTMRRARRFRKTPCRQNRTNRLKNKERLASPLEVGKQWFYYHLSKLGTVELKQGAETKELRDNLGLTKSKDKLSDKFEAHCVDSWVLANWDVGGHIEPENKALLRVIPIRFHRRQLHRLEHDDGHKRPRYGGTISAGFKRGSLVKHPKYGLSYIGGYMDSPTKKEPFRQVISLHCLKTSKRLTQNAKPQYIRFLTYNTWRAAFLPR